MVQALQAADLHVTASDITSGENFLSAKARPVECIVTNPPYALAQEFIEHALELMKPDGIVAMLLRCDFDHAKTRQHLFGKCPQFAMKLVLTKRIRWIENSIGSPSFNHAWFLWSWKHQGPPTLAYGP
jgi:methylase of polypeptide subunit release factors